MAAPAQQGANESAEPIAAVSPMAAEAQTDHLSKHLQEQANGLAALQNRQTDLEKRSLEAERKSIDWWLTAIGLGLTLIGALIAVVGVLLPWFWQRSERSRLRQAQAEFDRMQTIAQDTLLRLSKAETEAQASLTNTRETEAQAEDIRKRLRSFESSSQTGNVAAGVSKNDDAVQAAQSVVANPQTSDRDKLRARAVLASNKTENEVSTDQAQQIYDLWKALTFLDSDDSEGLASTHFNAGYWAQLLFEKSSHPGRRYWFDVLAQHYGKALLAKPDAYEAANNWGSALGSEAQTLKDQDLSAARALWKVAREKFAQALAIKPDEHVAANNWGNALVAEAQAIKDQDLVAARALWKMAGEKYAQALAIQPDTQEAAYNWGNALDVEAQAIQGQDLSGARVLWKSAGEKFAQALAIKPDAHEAANNWGSALAEEAKAIKDQDLSAARALWKQAGEKFALALAIKLDAYEVVNNWGNALSIEAQAIKDQDLNAARALWKVAGEKYAQALAIKPEAHPTAYNWGSAMLLEVQAIQKSNPDEAQDLLAQAQTLLERHRDMDPTGAAVVAYNLACVQALQGHAAECVQHLEISRKAQKLPDKQHLLDDKDLDVVRHTEVFQNWWQAHFGDAPPQ